MSTDLSATAIALGYAHTCAIEAGGGVKCWGDSDMGKLGVGNTNDLDTPAAVPGERNEARRQGDLRAEKGNGKKGFGGRGGGGLKKETGSGGVGESG
jgi:hypothetical protein